MTQSYTYSVICGGIGNFPKRMMPSFCSHPNCVIPFSICSLGVLTGGRCASWCHSCLFFFEMLCWSSGCLCWVGYDERTLFWSHQFNLKGEKTQSSKIKKGMSAFALYLLKPAEFKLWHVLNSTAVFERIWGNTTVFVTFAVLWQSCAKTLFFHYNLETLTVPKYLSFLKNVSATGEEWQPCVTVSAKC